MTERDISRARRKAYNYKQKHKPYPISCQLCGAEKTNMHHEDYSKWYEVAFLCYKCHRMVHMGMLSCPPPYDIRHITYQDIVALRIAAAKREIEAMKRALLREMA